MVQAHHVNRVRSDVVLAAVLDLSNRCLYRFSRIHDVPTASRRGAAGVPFEEGGRPDITFRGDSIHLEMRPILTYKLMLKVKYFDALNVLSARRKGCGARGEGE